MRNKVESCKTCCRGIDHCPPAGQGRFGSRGVRALRECARPPRDPRPPRRHSRTPRRRGGRGGGRLGCWHAGGARMARTGRMKPRGCAAAGVLQAGCRWPMGRVCRLFVSMPGCLVTTGPGPLALPGCARCHGAWATRWRSHWALPCAAAAWLQRRAITAAAIRPHNVYVCRQAAREASRPGTGRQ